VLATFSDKKYFLFPDATPTGATEWKSYVSTGYYVIAPKGLPQPILTKLIDASKKVVATDDFKTRSIPRSATT